MEDEKRRKRREDKKKKRKRENLKRRERKREEKDKDKEFQEQDHLRSDSYQYLLNKVYVLANSIEFCYGKELSPGCRTMFWTNLYTNLAFVISFSNQTIV